MGTGKLVQVEDWLAERDEYTHVRDIESKTRWDSTLEAGESFSSYLIDEEFARSLSFQKFILKAFDIARSTINALDIPYRVRITHTSKDGYGNATDGKLICLDTAVFDNDDLPLLEQLDVFIGEAVHEGYHCLRTDFKKVKKLINTVKTKSEKELLHSIFNVLEDESIEYMGSLDFPGFNKFIGKVKQYFFEVKYLAELGDLTEEITEADKLFTLFMRYVRFPEHVSEEDDEVYGDLIELIKDVLTPYPDNTHDVCLASKEVYNILEEFFKKEMDKKKKESDEKKEEGEGEKGEGGGEEEVTESMAEGMSEGMKEIVKKLLTTKAEEGSSPEPSESGSITSETSIKLREEAGTVDTGMAKNSYFHKPDDNVYEYKRIQGEVSSFASTLAKVLRFQSKDYGIVVKATRSGKLDTEKLSEAIQGVPTVYERYGEVKSKKAVVCLVIDESGSMTGSGVKKARECAILFNEALKKNPDVDLYIYGHTADLSGHSTDLFVYKEKGFERKYALGNVSARCQNRDGTAIMEAGQRVRKFTRRPMVMFVISDGQPAAGDYSGDAAIADTRNCVNYVEKKLNSTVIQIAVNVTYEPARMFKHWIKLADFSQLTRELGIMMKKVVKKMISAETTIF